MSAGTVSKGASRKAARLLGLIVGGDARLEGDGERLVAVAVGDAGLRRLAVAPADLEALIAAGLVVRRGATLTATAAGIARHTRDAHGDLGFRAQHGTLATVPIPDPATTAAAEPTPTGRPAAASTAVVDLAESPLGWLKSRGFLDAVEVEAGERLRADFTRGSMMPTVTSNWSIAASGGGGQGGRGQGGRGGLGDLTDAALAARERVRRALDAVGRDLADVLIDVCCFLKRLEQVEADRRWPPRSGKVVLRLALARLADHYGLGARATGRDRAPAILGWGTADHRPAMTGQRG